MTSLKNFSAVVIACLFTSGTFAFGQKQLTVPGREISRDNSKVNRVCHANRGQQIAVARERGAVEVIDTQRGKVIVQLVGHKKLVKGIAFSRDDSLVVTASYDDTIRIWAMNSGESVAVLPCGPRLTPRFAINPKAKEWLVA